MNKIVEKIESDLNYINNYYGIKEIKFKHYALTGMYESVLYSIQHTFYLVHINSGLNKIKSVVQGDYYDNDKNRKWASSYLELLTRITKEGWNFITKVK